MTLNWLRRWLGDAAPCESCESLRSEVNHLRMQNKQLLDNLLVKPEPVVQGNTAPVSLPKSLPWPVRRAKLESDDREKAARMRAEAQAARNAAKPDVITPLPVVDVTDLEKEMDMVASEREHA